VFNSFPAKWHYRHDSKHQESRIEESDCDNVTTDDELCVRDSEIRRRLTYIRSQNKTEFEPNSVKMDRFDSTFFPFDYHSLGSVHGTTRQRKVYCVNSDAIESLVSKFLVP
jgi:hypothetical protein